MFYTTAMLILIDAVMSLTAYNNIVIHTRLANITIVTNNCIQ